jgi:molybdate transport system substrate-binding protein
MIDLRILCAGAARGLVKAMEPTLVAETGTGVQGIFGAVGAMKEKLLAGEPCDVIVLTAAMIDELADGGHVRRDGIAPLGRVATGVAVRAGESLPDIADGAALAATLRAATGILFPDPARATAGIHFANVLKRLGVYAEVEARLATFPNGATAMRELAQSPRPGQVGCTQITEIRYTPGVTLAGPLPGDYGLSTVYSVAVCTNAAQPEIAHLFAELLAGPASQGLREAGGFET